MRPAAGASLAPRKQGARCRGGRRQEEQVRDWGWGWGVVK